MHVFAERNGFWSAIERHLGDRRPYFLAQQIAKSIRRHLTEIDNPLKAVVSLQPSGPKRGDALLSYRIQPFVTRRNGSVPLTDPARYHSSYWECEQMAKTLLDLGFAVDVIDWQNREFVPRKPYSVVLDVRHNLSRLAPLLPKECIKIYHADSAHVLSLNAAETQRLLSLQKRRGVTLPLVRWEHPYQGVEHADYVTYFGNEYTRGTYAFAGKPMFPVPVTTTSLHPWPEQKDFTSCRKNFLWFGSAGLVHKGLDLVLEVFSQLPEYDLTVCGPIRADRGVRLADSFYQDKAFELAYHNELYNTPNIHTIGWVEVNSPEFRSIVNSCIAVVLPSSSEGQNGGVISCLHSALIPIVSFETGVDVDDFGFVLRTSSIEEIKKAVCHIANLPADRLTYMARNAWAHARANHTRESFAKRFRGAIEAILADHRKCCLLEAVQVGE